MKRNTDLGLVVVFAACLVIAAFAVATPVVLLNTDYTSLGELLPPQKQKAETALYLLMALVVGPLSLFLSWRLVSRIRSGPNRECLGALVAALVIPLGLGLYLVSHSGELPWGRGVYPTLYLGLGWFVYAAAVLAGPLRMTPWRPSGRLTSATRPLAIAATVSVAAALLSLVDFGHVDWLVFAIGLALTALAAAVYAGNRLKRPPRRWGVAFDIAFLLLLMAAIPDLGDAEPATGGFSSAYLSQVAAFHQALFVGAANQVLGGSALLVDTVSQYGVGSIYFIAAFFELTSIGFSALAFLEGIVTALVFGLAYGVLRMAGVSRALAAGAMVTALVALAWGLSYPVGELLQHGSIRFGLPMCLIAPVVAGVRWPRSRPAMIWVALVVTGVSSIWALEALVYVTATVAGLIAISATWVEPRSRLRFIAVAAGAVVASWVVAHLAFALATLAASGSLPDWGLYLTYLREFLTGSIGELNYDMSPWSSGLAVFGICMFSAFGLVVLTIARRDFTASRRPAFVALAALTAYGTVLYSYFDNRSIDHVLPYISLPALLVATIWIGLALDRRSSLLDRSRVATLAVSMGLAALAVASVWPAARDRGENSLLAYSVPGGRSLPDALDRVWDPPPVRPASLVGQKLIEKYFPGQDAVPVLAFPNLDLEMLVRSGRYNRLGITDGNEQSWVPGPHLDEIRRKVDGLEAGDRMVVDSRAKAAYEVIRNDPAAALEDPDPAVDASGGLQRTQVITMAWIAQRFTLRTVATGPEGISVVELEPG
ncbi:MAG: hypothetical protein JJE10_04495 [Thermoleophilia bacterium]|nr:hypothetical protein [Thermoleophilia bacterium]